MGTERTAITEHLPDRRHPLRLDDEMYRAPGQIVFITMCARGDRRLTDAHVAETLCDAMGRVGRRRKTRVHAYCIMPDHVHVVVSVMAEGGDAAKWTLYVKREAAKVLHSPGMWQRSYWDRHARPDDSVVGMVPYVLNNPVRRGLCEAFDEWPFSWSEWHPETRGRDPNHHASRGAGPDTSAGKAPAS